MKVGAVEFVALAHPRFVRAQKAVFTARVTPDCMAHRCALRTENGRTKLDACCQYGVDCDLGERDNILARSSEIRALLNPDVRGQPWFAADERIDRDFPSGRFVRTTTQRNLHNGEVGCVFLAHDSRGCAIHRASIEGGWDFHGTKPHVCRLFPISYDVEAIVLSDDYDDYSCSRDRQAPSVYRVARADLGAIFGGDLIVAMDRAEQIATAEKPGRLPLAQ